MSPSPDPIEAVSQRLDKFVGARYAQTGSMGAEAVLFVDAAADALRGGKRLRARFCLTGWRAVTADGDAPAPAEAVGAAAALEVFHAAALVHDDIVDNSDTRRGRPAAHRALEAAHRDAGWHGDAAAFGRSGAILLGDLLVAWSDDLLEESLHETPPSRAAAVRAEYAGMRRDVTLGQFLDIAEESAYAVSPDAEHARRALQVASFKSARYSIQQPLLIGAALADADEQTRAMLAAFGHAVGMAFQLRDDVLGVFGDAAVTGKPSGDDLREGKRTVLVAYAREGMDAAGRRRFDERLGDRGLGDDDVRSLQDDIVATGALDRLETLIATYAAEADAALSTGALAPHALTELRELAHAATTRSF